MRTKADPDPRTSTYVKQVRSVERLSFISHFCSSHVLITYVRDQLLFIGNSFTMQTSTPEDPSLRTAPGVSEHDAIMSGVNEHALENEQTTEQQPGQRCTPHPPAKPPPYSQGPTFETDETVGPNSSHETPVDIRGNLHPSQNGAINSDDYEAKIKELEEKLEKCQKQSDINAENTREAETKLNEEQAKLNAILKQFNKAKAQSQSHMIHHVDDSELSKEVDGLRYNILNMSSQYFADAPPTVKTYKDWQQKRHGSAPLSTYLGMKWDTFSNLMRSQSSQRVTLVQALIWATLCETLFAKFAWASEKAASAINDLKEDLRKSSIWTMICTLY
jgi:flagellar biosynthesis GTPase FlhF